jgi:ATP-dependent DNA helicase DinG
MLPETQASNALANIPSLIPAAGGALICDANGATRRIGMEEARKRFRSGDVILAHTAFVSGRLRTPPQGPLYDAMELFAFVRPAQPCVPSPMGLARALGFDWPTTPEESAETLHAAVWKLLAELEALSEKERIAVRPLVYNLKRAGWRWADPIFAVVGEGKDRETAIAGLDVWRNLKEWEDEPSPGKPGANVVSESEAHGRLAVALGADGEARPEQQSYVDAALYAFSPRERVGAPRVALLEAGTGTGKTLGYLAPASLWAEKNGPGLWISTYTRNLQRQILQEIARLYPDPAERRDKAVVRKGRENYLCVLNFEDAARRTALTPGQRAVALGLIARWIGATEDGDVSGAGFPAFLGASLPLREVTDRRGECIYAACPHYRICFIERAIRRARTAPIVVANHALVIAQAAGNTVLLDETNDAPGERRLRLVLDEGHHLFDAADSGFAAVLSGMEMAELRRWIRGSEGRSRSRMRGLQERLRDLIEDDASSRLALDEALNATSALVGDGWMSRLHNGMPASVAEAFLAATYAHVRARSENADVAYSLEAEPHPVGEELARVARELAVRLKELATPLVQLAYHLRAYMTANADELASSQRGRIEAAARSLDLRAKIVLPAWISMLDSLDTGELNDEFVDWFEIEREDGRDRDVGMRRHWIDPTIPLASEVLVPAHGALITSATLRDSSDTEDWASADVRTGATHLSEPARRASFGSPFRYADQSRIFIVRDVERRDADQLAAAYRELFLASGGGALGLFTAVRALRNVESRISPVLAEAGITLYAQHVDRLDTGALVDLFRSEENACLLGTDALRDGVDVPGRSLRLAVFDKVPWPKPSILHKARRARFGKQYDEQIARLRLKQAFGRLIRSEHDKGCFVILEGATPSKLLTAFPPEAPVARCGLAEAIAEIRGFLGEAR